MGTALRRVFAVLVLFYLLALAIFFGWTWFLDPKADMLASFMAEYAWKSSLGLFLEYLVPIHASAIVVAFSLRFGKKAAAAPDGGAFAKFVGSTVLAFILMTALYTILAEGFLPGVRTRLAEMRYLTTLARQYRALAEESFLKGDGRAALDLYKQVLAIDKDDGQAAEGRLSAEALAARQDNAREKAARDRGEDPRKKEAAAEPDAEALLKKAWGYFNGEDWFSAHYYASRAYAADRTRMDAKRLADDAWRMIGDVRRMPKADTAAQALYGAKKKAYGLLAGGDYVEAYYVYLDLFRAYPSDREIQDQLAQSRAGMEATVFYLDDADRAASMPGTRRILLRNAEEAGFAEAVAIGKMVELPEATYLFDIEAIRYTAGGEVSWHLSAARGTILGAGRVLLHGADRDKRREEKPVYHAGARPAAERDYLTLRRSLEDLRSMGAGRQDLSTLSLTALWTRRAEIVSSGARDEDVSLEIAMKALSPFLFLIFSLFAVSLGWAYRARYLGRPPLPVLLLVPLVPLTVGLAALLYAYAHRVILGFTVLSLGLMGALAVLGGMELAFLIVAIVLLAGQAAS